MNLEQLLQIVLLEVIGTIVMLFLLIPYQTDTLEMGHNEDMVESQCSEHRARIHRKNGRVKFMHCIVKLNNLEWIRNRITRFYSHITYDNQDVWVIEQVVKDITCFKKSNMWIINKKTLLISGKYAKTTVC